MNAATTTTAKKATKSATATATLHVLMLNAPRITHPETDSWLVDVYDVKRGKYVRRAYGPLPEALKALRYELNMHIVELHRLAGEAGVLA